MKKISRAAAISLASLLVLIPSSNFGEETAPPLALPTNVVFDEDHDVFYQEQFRFLSARAREIIPRAFKNVSKQWGLTDSSGFQHPLTVQIKNLPSKTLVRRIAAYVQAKGRGQSLAQVLVIDIGCYLQQPQENLEMILSHELAHAILADLEASPGAAAIPAWLNEGLAQSVTREGRDRVGADIKALRQSAAPLVLCDLEGPVDEFTNGPFNLNSGCYPEYYLAVRYLQQKGGPHTLPRLFTGLRQGAGMAVLTPLLIRMDWPSFKKAAEQYASDVFRETIRIP